MTLENEAQDESEFFSPDDDPTSEVEDTEADAVEDDEAEQDEGDDDPEVDETEGDEKAEGDDADDGEFEEIEHDGKTHRIPKDLKPLLMMQQDYTRKTQEVADQRKALEQQRAKAEAELRQQAETVRQFTSDIAQIRAIDDRLHQYAQVDWNAWREQDFMAASGGFQEYQLLKDQRAQMVQSLQHKQSQARQEAEARSREAQQNQEAEIAKRREETARTLQREIPGWNAEVASAVADFALRSGYTRDELINAAVDHRAFVMLHKAYLYDLGEAQQKAAAKKAKAATQPEAKPLKNVAKGRSAPATAGLDDRLSADEWVRRRNEQLRKRRG